MRERPEVVTVDTSTLRHQPLEHVLVVPAQELRIRTVCHSSRQGDLPPVHRVVCLAVLPFPREPLAHHEAVIGGHRDVARVEQPVNVRPQQETVHDFMRSIGPVGPNVGGFQDRERMLAADRACAVVSACDCHAEATLPEPRPDELCCAVPRCLRIARQRREWRRGARSRGSPLEALVPDATTLPFIEIVPRPGDDVRTPVSRLRDPLAIREEHGRGDHDATDPMRLPGGLADISAHAPRHRVERRRAVVLPERLPREPHGGRLVAREHPKAADGVVRGLELEEERRPGRRIETVGGWLPEVHLVHGLAIPQEREPVVVGGGHVAAHEHIVPQ